MRSAPLVALTLLASLAGQARAQEAPLVPTATRGRPALPPTERSTETVGHPDTVELDDDELDDDEPRPERDLVARIGDALREDARQSGRVRWDPSWPRYRADELVLTLGLGLVIAMAEFLPTRSDPNWSIASDLDVAVQGALGLADPQARAGVALASDLLVTTLILWPLAVDSLLYAGVGEGAWDVAWQLSLISLEVFAINHALNIAIKLLSRRERPIGVHCRERPGYASDPHCQDPPPAESFWSGHVSNAFAGAALVCLHHDVLDLFGDAGADGAACGTALAMASATGLFRIMSDRHWVTDVLTGAVVGSLIGVLVPWLLHYQGGARPALRGTSAPPIALAPMLDQNTLGMSAFGLW